MAVAMICVLVVVIAVRCTCIILKHPTFYDMDDLNVRSFLVEILYHFVWHAHTTLTNLNATNPGKRMKNS